MSKRKQEDVSSDTKEKFKTKQTEEEKVFTGKGSKVATTRLTKELKKLTDMDASQGFEVVVDEENFYKWRVKLFGFPAECPLGKDLTRYSPQLGYDWVELDMTFPHDYPWSPPFVRVVKPRFKFHTGHITVGGSICMELLTKSGWEPINNLESLLIQIRAEMVAGGAELDGTKNEYTEEEARAAFTRVARQHGWE